MVDLEADLYSDAYCYVVPIIDTSNTNYFDLSSLQIHNIAWIIAAICAFFACVLSFIQIYKHLSNYTNEAHQKHIVRILLMVPIYSIDSFLSFRFYWLSVYFDVVRDCYEAFVIYTFYSLLIEWVGGYQHGKEIFSQKPEFKLSIPLCFITAHAKRGLLRWCKRLTLQYVVIRPAMTLLALILHSARRYCPGNYSPIHGYLWVTVINFVSVTVAMYALVLFYSRSHEEIAKYKPIPKFLSVKFVIFLSFWQSIVVSAFVTIHGLQETTYWSTENISTGVQNGLLCGEMLIAAIWHLKAFSDKEYANGRRTPILKSAMHCFSPHDIAQDVYASFYPKSFAKNRSLITKEEQQKAKQQKQDEEKQEKVGKEEEEEEEVELELRKSNVGAQKGLSVSSTSLV